VSRALPLIVVIAALATGCGGTTSHGERLKPAQLGSLVLRTHDLGGAFTQFDQGRQVRADAHPGPRGDVLRFGRQDGWKSRFRRVGAGTAGPLIVESRADVFAGSGGAAKDIDAYVAEWRATAAVASAREITFPTVDGLGDDARAFDLLQGTRANGQRLIGVAWRRGRITASVVASGLSALRLRDVLLLAREQDARVVKAEN
jgi:hypothetical protein